MFGERKPGEMQGRARQKPDEEPAVTFELEEARPQAGRRRLGAVGTTALTGVGLASGGAAPDFSDSLDVFDHPVAEDMTGEIDALEAPDAIPTVNFDELMDAAPDPDFPAIDFSLPASTSDAAGVETLHGAQGAVGGGFRLDDPAAQDVFGAPAPLAEAVDDRLVDALDDDSDALLQEAEADDLG